MGEQILIIEDDDDTRGDLDALLALSGYPVSSAANGLEALHLLQSGARPFLILLDLMMPVMDGWSFHAVLTGDSALADIPVIILSGIGNAEKEARDLKTAGFLQKPFKLDRLLSLIEEHLPSP